ncbi:MAG: hypothetical protein AB7G75_24910 [Candidatus Binatia bacterium]
MKTVLLIGIAIGVGLTAAESVAEDLAIARRLGISLATLQESLEKVGGSVTFAPRPGSAQGTQEARLPNQAGVVQAAGDAENLGVVVVWAPIDQQRKTVAAEARGYLETLTGMFLADREKVLLWVDQVINRAIEERAEQSHLESQLFDGYQMKVMYATSLSRPMVSLTISASTASEK